MNYKILKTYSEGVDRKTASEIPELLTKGVIKWNL